MGDLLQADLDTVALYHECAARHAGLSAWVVGQ